MNKFIQVSTHHTECPNRFHVVFATATHTGILPVEIERQTQDPAIVAELFALRHLLEMAEIGSPGTGASAMDITVSKGAIKKLIQGRSAKTHLLWCTCWLKLRYFDANITVSHKQTPSYAAIVDATNKGLNAIADYKITVYHPLGVGSESNPDIVLHNSVVGACTISMHAIERYMERSGTACWSKAWSRVVGLIQRSDSCIADIPDSVMRRKRLKHCDREKIIDVGNGWFLVFNPNRHQDGQHVLCTVYQRRGHFSRIAA